MSSRSSVSRGPRYFYISLIIASLCVLCVLSRLFGIYPPFAPFVPFLTDIALATSVRGYSDPCALVALCELDLSSVFAFIRVHSPFASIRGPHSRFVPP